MTNQRTFILGIAAALITGCAAVSNKQTASAPRSDQDNIECYYHVKSVSSRWAALTPGTAQHTLKKLKQDTKNFDYALCSSNNNKVNLDLLINNIIPDAFRNNLGLSLDEARHQQGVFYFKLFKNVFYDN